jgi:hypothetical protein
MVFGRVVRIIAATLTRDQKGKEQVQRGEETMKRTWCGACLMLVLALAATPGLALDYWGYDEGWGTNYGDEYGMDWGTDWDYGMVWGTDWGDEESWYTEDSLGFDWGGTDYYTSDWYEDDTGFDDWFAG